MRYNLPTPAEFLPVAEEMCPQFKNALASGSDEHWAEKALLTVLLNRKRNELHKFIGQEEIHRAFEGDTREDEHVLRRAKIYQLLGLHGEAARLMDSLHAHPELV